MSNSLSTVNDIELVVRSPATPVEDYKKYRPILRRDFIYSCGYCGIMESEASAMRMVIDHYDPQHAFPTLANSYDNLIYSCEECNLLKGPRVPTTAARIDGHRFFRPDVDRRSEHFALSGVRVDGKTNVGNFSVDALDLNRLSLRRVRDLRKRLGACDEQIADGVFGLRRLPLDRLPKDIRARAANAIGDAAKEVELVASAIDSLLADLAQSPLTIEDGQAIPEDNERLDRLKRIEGMYPGRWRNARGSKAKQSRAES